MSVILFDMDGTLLDTEPWYTKAWKMAAEEFGYVMTKEMQLAMRSLGHPFLEWQFREWFGEQADVNKVKSYRRFIMEPWFQKEIPLKPQVKETLDALRDRGHRTAVVTASPWDRTSQVLTKTGLYDCFERIVCVNMVEKGKPAPDVYLYACEEMEVDPASAFAVEDSPNGVRSAAAAGCKVIMIPDLTKPDPELEKLLYQKVDALKELLPFFP